MTSALAIIIACVLLFTLKRLKRLIKKNHDRKLNELVDNSLPKAHKDVKRVIDDVIVLGKDLEFIKYFDGVMDSPFFGSASGVLKSKAGKFYKASYGINAPKKSVIITDIKLMSNSEVKVTLQDNIKLYTKYIGVKKRYEYF